MDHPFDQNRPENAPEFLNRKKHQQLRLQDQALSPYTLLRIAGLLLIGLGYGEYKGGAAVAKRLDQ